MHFEFFGPAPSPDHPRYKPRYDHFSHPIPSCPKVTADDATNDTESTVDDATDATDIVLNDNLDRKSDDDDDSEFYLYKGPSAPFALQKLLRDINSATTTAKKPAVKSAMSPIDPIILPPAFPLHHNSTTCKQFLHLEKLAVSCLIPHDSFYLR